MFSIVSVDEKFTKILTIINVFIKEHLLVDFYSLAIQSFK